MAKAKNNEGTKFLRYFGPLLDALRKLGGSGRPDEVVEQIASDMSLSDDEQNDVVPSGGSRLKTNVAWARFYLVREGLLDSSKRGIWSLTEKGRTAHLTVVQAGEIFARWVKVFDEQRKSKGSQAEPIAEQVAEANGAAPNDYREEALKVLLSLPPAGLVSFKVLFQCKRYSKSVSSPEVRDFRGAMAGRADKGIVITTGTFTAEAKKEASRDGVPPIELINGEKLIDMLENLEIGLRPITTYEVDHGFFTEFRQV
jgi:restriction system protein